MPAAGAGLLRRCCGIWPSAHPGPAAGAAMPGGPGGPLNAGNGRPPALPPPRAGQIFLAAS